MIALKAGAAGFGDATKPRYVLDFFFENSAGGPEPNAQYNSMATDLTVMVGTGNVGGVGVRLRGAQGSGLEDVTVHAGDGLAGVVGGCGSGGAHHGLRVTGGRYGLDLRQGQPTGTVSGTILEGQRCAGLVYAGFESLSAVGISIIKQKGCVGAVSTDVADSTFELPKGLLRPGAECSLPMMPTSSFASLDFPGDYQQTNVGIAGKMSFIDSQLDFAAASATGSGFGSGGGGCPAGKAAGFSIARSLFLQNVYVRGTPTLVATQSKKDGADVTAATPTTQVQRLVIGIDPPIFPSRGGNFSVKAALYVDGARQKARRIVKTSAMPPASAPPLDLVSRHRWPAAAEASSPSFESARCVNAKKNGAKGDGATDDYAALQALLDSELCVYLPRGLYLTSCTLQVHAGRALVGVARHLTRIASMDAGLSGPPRHPNRLRPFESKRGASAGAILPVLEVLPAAQGDDATEAAKAATTYVAFLSVSIWNSINSTSAMHWHASNGVYRQLHANRANRCGALWRPGCKESVEINYPLQQVIGASDVKLYTYYDEDCCNKNVTSKNKAAPGQPEYWGGFLAGPQGPHYRHLKLDGASHVGFYHLNCEHGTGEAICEFSNSTMLSVYGLKTEGRFVTLWVRDCDDVSVFGTGGCGCSANDTIYPPRYAKGYPPTLYRVERTPNFQFSSLIDQHAMEPLSKYPNIRCIRKSSEER